jgi:hypothetical protein
MPRPRLAGFTAQQVAPFEPDRAAARLDEARDHLQGRGLAAARRAEEGDEIALADGQAEILDGDVCDQSAWRRCQVRGSA